MRILLTNDDGYSAPGMTALAQAIGRWCAAAPIGEVREAVIAAPHTNYSGMAAAVGDVFEDAAVRYERHVIAGAENIPTYALEAAPALCAALGALGTFDFTPDIIVSGINAGSNVGHSILHSGTVGAILSGGQLGLSGLAVSIQYAPDAHYDAAAAMTVQVLEHVMNAGERFLLNFNVPNLPLGEIKGVARGHISSAGVLLAGGPRAGGEPLGSAGLLPLLFGPATPELGDVSDEASDEDGALVASGYACLTPLVGPHESYDPLHETALRASLGALDEHLRTHR